MLVMRFCYVLAVTAFAFTLSNDGLAAAADLRRPIDSLHGLSGRMLREAKTTDTDFTYTEERGISELADDVIKLGGPKLWASIGKTDDYAKKVLNLENLTGQALKNHQNYKIFEEFLDKVDERKVKEWISKDTPTAEVWKILGLDKLTEAQRKDSDALRTYIRYATALDDEIWNLKRASFEPEISSGDELAVKVRLWAKAGRPMDYVFEMMGKNAMKGNPNYKYYKLFQKLVKEQRAQGGKL